MTKQEFYPACLTVEINGILSKCCLRYWSSFIGSLFVQKIVYDTSLKWVV